ncbi:hypothetical protein CcaCcLH18_08681 [Colletotrichum camelliae]|nr:hypothetical protein CcaCcLH18_08681 [Colletotrichum camelliae]
MTTGAPRELQSIGVHVFATFKTLSQSPWASDGSSNAPSRRRIEAEHQRLRLWAQNLGLNQTGHASLDYRVRDASIIKASLVDLLSELQDHLENFASIVFGHRMPAEQTQVPIDSDEESSDAECSSIGTDTFHEVDFRINSVVERIDSLYKLAAKIRNPRYRPQRPVEDLYKHIPESQRQEFRKDQENLEIVRVAFFQKEYLLQSVTTDQLETLQCKSEDLLTQYGSSAHWLIRRIGIANARRCQQFGYWKTHAEILARDITLEALPPKPHAGGIATVVTQTREPGAFSLATSATKLDEKMLCSPSDERSVISQHSRVSTVIFATLMYIGKPCYIANFVLDDIWDDQLPLDLTVHKEFFGGWKHQAAWFFCQWQYRVLAPVIDFTTTEHRKFGEKYRMPFVDALDFTASGTFGSVSKVRIHEAHQIWKLPMHPQKYYAIKHFRRHGDKAFYMEREALATFSRPNKVHDHLMELLFSYEIGADKFLILPWANCNLEEFWKKYNSRPSAMDDLIWLIKQCLGLADGLCDIHSWYGTNDDIGDNGENINDGRLGRHGDIKPRNILFFSSEDHHGRLVITDSIYMHFYAPNTEDTHASKVGFSATYRPPEVDEHDVQVTQKYDIWTLGCVFLEFITWHLVGYNAIYERHFQDADGGTYDSFSEMRLGDDDKKYGYPEDKFFNPDDNLHHAPRAKVKDSWIDFLKQHPNASPASRDLLEFIIERMIVISPDNRRSMRAVRRELGRILDKSQDANGTEFFLPAPPPVTKVRRYPPPFTGDKSYGKLAVEPFREPHSSSGALSNSTSDLNMFEEMFSPPVTGDLQPQARDNDIPVSPEASSVRESQRFEGSIGEMQETASEELDMSAGMTGSGQKIGTSRLARLGRLIPSNIRKRFRS